MMAILVQIFALALLANFFIRRATSAEEFAIRISFGSDNKEKWNRRVVWSDGDVTLLNIVSRLTVSKEKLSQFIVAFESFREVHLIYLSYLTDETSFLSCHELRPRVC